MLRNGRRSSKPAGGFAAPAGLAPAAPTPRPRVLRTLSVGQPLTHLSGNGASRRCYGMGFDQANQRAASPLPLGWRRLRRPPDREGFALFRSVSRSPTSPVG